MPKKLQYKIMFILCVISLALYYVVPSISWHMKNRLPGELSSRKVLKLGLDLQGGVRLLLEVETDKVGQEEQSDVVDRALEIIRNVKKEFTFQFVIRKMP